MVTIGDSSWSMRALLSYPPSSSLMTTFIKHLQLSSMYFNVLDHLNSLNLLNLLNLFNLLNLLNLLNLINLLNLLNLFNLLNLLNLLNLESPIIL